MKFITVKGREILRVDLFDYKFERFDELLEMTGGVIRSQPENSVLLLTVANDFSPMFTNKDIFVDYLKKNKPYIRASACCGASPALLPIVNSVDHSAGRADIMIYATEEEAIKWLLEQ